MEKISFAKAQNLSAIEIRNFIRKESYVILLSKYHKLTKLKHDSQKILIYRENS